MTVHSAFTTSEFDKKPILIIGKIVAIDMSYSRIFLIVFAAFYVKKYDFLSIIKIYNE